MTKLYSIEVIVRSEIKDGYRLKVSDLGLGIYVDGFRATKSSRNASGWWVQPPSTYVKRNGEYAECPEYDKKTSYWEEIEQACVEAAQLAESDKAAAIDDTTTLSEQDLDEAIKRFGLSDSEEPKAVSWREPGERL